MAKKEADYRDARLNRVCVLEDLDFWWDRPELTAIKKLWKKEISVVEIAQQFDRDPDEVLLALIHLAKDDRINKRKKGLA